MQSSLHSKTAFAVAAVLTAALCQILPGQEAQKGMQPRATPADYQANAKAGDITLAADFTGHSIATPDAVYSTENYVVVEVAFFGPPQAHTKFSYEDFSLRINGKKTLLPAQPYALVFHSLKDPEWAPPESAEPKSKTSIDGGDKPKSDPNNPPAPVHVPIEVERAMELRVQKASLPGGDRVLPGAGLIFFQHMGKASGIHSVDLIYTGPAGNATLTLQP